MKVLVTGATGFVGLALLEKLCTKRYSVCAAVRRSTIDLPKDVEPVLVGDIDSDTDYEYALTGVDTIIHLAARVHVTRDASSDQLSQYRKVNVDGTMALARQAVKAGIRRFIYISSIKVNGEETSIGSPFSADDTPAPVDPYSISKYEAERALLDLGENSKMEVVIIRPPLVYGPGVKANFLSMMRWLKRGMPLPLGSINNKRSLVALDNLVDLIIRCIEHPAAANQVFLVSDGEDMSTTELLRRLANALGVNAHLLPIPTGVLKIGAFIIGKSAISNRLCGSLQVDIKKNKDLLDWEPPYNVDASLYKIAEYYLSVHDK